MPTSHQIGANSHTCGSDAVTFAGSMGSLEVTLNVCHTFGSSGFPFQKSGGVQYFGPNL